MAGMHSFSVYFMTCHILSFYLSEGKFFLKFLLKYLISQIIFVPDSQVDSFLYDFSKPSVFVAKMHLSIHHLFLPDFLSGATKR